MNVQQRLFALKDENYASFIASLIPTLPKEKFIGVRVPQLRKLAKEYSKEGCVEFFDALPHQYYEENLLHCLLLCLIKDKKECLRRVEQFLPYIDNWSVCDTLRPKCFASLGTPLLTKAKQWASASLVYTCRFGVGILMSYFLDDAYQKEYLEIPAKIHSSDYYVNMMIAWFYATALAKQWEDTIPYLITNRLDPWVHNKTIQKAKESFRISSSQKEYLSTLKR